ncbi:Bifunctional ATP-dependent dihydroxyacetone kinase/FAD-AMP lyase (cyclizing) [Habropoda laboriosa]|uniref:Bifunctional ATP-dependent dihydroxyacetone kinase/FAD-AMP lyase (Cyclizing) n=1 Tax=Habropoda laboriosa TaxID=597456 RepID=A0A0L7QN70_9HYME|nr:Bifunctional ATP-dependent dihydroxyacetone kinase/FAD-AMP lyase (cyclizing) [Habropoda laboriosa]
MKSLVNSVNDAVTETLFGVSFQFPQLEYQVSHKVVLMPKLQDRKNKVSLVCGGGSGHEPFAAGKFSFYFKTNEIVSTFH